MEVLLEQLRGVETGQPAATTNLPGVLPKLWPCLVVCGLAAFWIDFTAIHAEQHADSLLPVLISLYRWTPFYWGLDRIGMLAPFIALPFKHPLANLLVQDWLYLFGSLAGFVLLARYVLRDATYPLVGLLCIAAFVGLTPSYYRFHYLIDTQYGLWLSLGLAGLLLLEANAQGRVSLPRRIGAVVLLILAHWCYCTASLFLGPLVVSRWLLFRRVPARMRTRMLFGELAASLTSLALAFVVGLLLMRLSPVTNTDFGTLPVDEWPRTLYRLLATTWQHLAPQWWPLTLAAGLLVALLGTRSSGYDSALASAWRSAAVFVGAAALLTLFLATRRWVPENSYRIRFLFIPAIYAQAACVSLTVATCAARCGGFVHRVVLPMGGALVFLTVAVCLGRPGLSEVRGALARRQATVDARGRPVHIRPEDVLATACTHIAGNYWLVWPAMFHANLALCDRGEDRVVWGLSKSSEPTSDFWRAIPRAQTRIAVFAQGDEEANQFLSSFGFLPLLACEKRDSVIVLEPAESAVRTSGLTR